MPLMILAAVLSGAVWIGFVGVLRHYRGVNETIASLLMYYIAVSIMNFFSSRARCATRPTRTSRRPSPSATATWWATSPGLKCTGG